MVSFQCIALESILNPNIRAFQPVSSNNKGHGCNLSAIALLVVWLLDHGGSVAENKLILKILQIKKNIYFHHPHTLNSSTKLRFLFTILLSFSFAFCWSQTGNSSISSSTKFSKITEGFYYADSNCAVTFSQVMQPGFNNKFRYGNLEKIPLQDNINCYWVKYKIINAINNNNDWVLDLDGWKVAEVYSTDKNGVFKKQLTGHVVPVSEKALVKANKNLIKLTLAPGDSIQVIAKLVTGVDYMRQPSDLSATIRSFSVEGKSYQRLMYFVFFFSGIYVVMFLYNLFIYFSTRDKSYRYYLFLIFFSLFALLENTGYSQELLSAFQSFPAWSTNIDLLFSSLFGINIILFTRSFLKTKTTTPVIDKIFNFLIIALIIVPLPALFGQSLLATNISSLLGLITTTLILVTSFKAYRKGYPSSGIFLAANGIFMVSIFLYLAISMVEPSQNMFSYFSMPVGATIQIVLFSFALGNKINALKKDNEESQKKIITQLQRYNDLQDKVNRELEHKVQERTAELKNSQKQLLQQEKLASLGELTAGIAHEIQNPLNFVNNFSEVNKEMIAELKDEIDKGNYDDAKLIADDIEANEEKINHHGKRADAIVKGMLQHSRSSTGVKEPTDINALCDEYLRLSYQGLRAKDKDFNAEIKTDFDDSIGKINIVPQDIGRVLLNLYNNAFYAVNEKQKLIKENYQPAVLVSTKKAGDKVILTVKDNGNGISQKIVDKIFQPFFTTKPTGQGTGLGLSLSYDIIKAHGGEIRVETKEGEGSEFLISLHI